MGAIRLQDEKPDGTGMQDRAQQARTLIHKTTVISPKKNAARRRRYRRLCARSLVRHSPPH